MSNLYNESEKLKAELKIFKLKSLKEKIIFIGIYNFF
jgi:hypothetical protein